MDCLTLSMKRTLSSYLTAALLALAGILMITATARGQVSNEILDVSPNAAAAGTIGLHVTFTLDTDAPFPPPAGVMPDSVMLGTIAG